MAAVMNPPMPYATSASFGNIPYLSTGAPAVNGPAISGSGFNPAAPALSGPGLANYAAPVNTYYYGNSYQPYPTFPQYSTYPTYPVSYQAYPAGYSYSYNTAAPVVGVAPTAAATAPVASAVPAPVLAPIAAPLSAPLQLDEATVAEIESRVQYLATRRQPMLRRQIIKVPGAVGRVQQVVRRLPTPPPDVIERVYVVKPQRDVVNVLIERPATPPPQVQERRVVGKTHRPVINQQVVRVAPRLQYNISSYGVPAPQPVAVSYAAAPVAAPLAAPVATNISASYDQFAAYGGYAAAPAFTTAAYQPVAYSTYQAPPVDAYAAYGYSYGYPYGYSAGYAAPSVVGGYNYAAPTYGYTAPSVVGGYNYTAPNFGYAAPSVVGGYNYVAPNYAYTGLQPSTSGIAGYYPQTPLNAVNRV